MDYALFIYNVFTILLYGVCGFGFLTLYFRGKNQRDLWIAVMFFVFILDNLIYAMTEFIPHFMELYRQMIHWMPYFNNLVTIAMIYSYRMILAYTQDDLPSHNERLLQLFLFVLLFLTTAMASAKAGRLAYLALNQLAVAAILIRGYWVLIRRPAQWTEKSRRKVFWLLTGAAALHMIGLTERLVMLLGSESFKYRALGFEAFGLMCVAVALWYLFTQLSRVGQRVSEQDVMELFIRHYRLTPREAELLPLLLAGEDNAAIGEKNCISLNTVKVHTHNIYQKLGIERRSQISGCLSEFKRQFEK